MLTDWNTIIINIAILPKLIYRYRKIFIKISASLFIKTDKVILKFIWRFKSPTILKRKNS